MPYFKNKKISGQVFDLAHLDPFVFNVRHNETDYPVRVTFEDHVFTAAIPDRFFLLFIIMLLYLFFKYLFRAIFSPKICLPSGKTISSGKNDAEFVPQTSVDAGNA